MKKRVTVFVEVELFEKIKSIAYWENLTLTQIIDKALRKEIENKSYKMRELLKQ